MPEEETHQRNGFYVGAVVLLVLVLISICILWCQWSNIKIGLAILEASSDFVSSN
jgi:hypothetical protein